MTDNNEETPSRKRSLEEHTLAPDSEGQTAKRLYNSPSSLQEELATLRTLLQVKDAEITNLRREVEQWRQCFSECGATEPEHLKREWKDLQQNDEKLKSQIADLKLRESALVIRLSQKEKEISDLTSQLADLRRSLLPEVKEVRTILLDPMVNLQVQRMRDELAETEKRLKETQEELEAVQFNAQSMVGKKLLAKCRVLQEENDEFGRQLSEGTLSTHKIELNLLKELVAELKRNLAESHEFVLQLDAEVEMMQNRIFELQQQLTQLKKWKELYADQQKELERLQQRLQDTTTHESSEIASIPPLTVSPHHSIVDIAGGVDDEQEEEDENSRSSRTSQTPLPQSNDADLIHIKDAQNHAPLPDRANDDAPLQSLPFATSSRLHSNVLHDNGAEVQEVSGTSVEATSSEQTQDKHEREEPNETEDVNPERTDGDNNSNIISIAPLQRTHFPRQESEERADESHNEMVE
jgi:chromosome segregation ATPase